MAGEASVGESGEASAASNSTFGGAAFDLGADFGIVAVRSAVQLVSDGTTGLRAWEASAALSEWLFEHAGAWAGGALRGGDGRGLETGTITPRFPERQKPSSK